MEIRELRTFRTVAMLLSFNKAAGKLNYAQSSVSAQIKSLEDKLGVNLFDRLGRRIRLTEAGARLTRYADKILELEEETRNEIAGTKDVIGTLTVRIPESVGIYRLSPVIGQFAIQYPKVQLNFTTCAHESLPGDLRKGITDLAFLLSESVRSKDLDTEVMGFESLALVAAPGHALAIRERVSTQDLKTETILLSRADCSYRRMFEQILNEANAVPANIHSFQSTQTLKQCVISGAGITILPEIAVIDDLEQGKLVRLNWDEGGLETALHMIWFKARWRPPALEAFMNMIREHFRRDWAAA